jgi:hypothetical protein
MKYLLIAALSATCAVASAAPAAAADAPFGCEARAPSVCYFRLFFTPRGGRVIVLPAGMKTKVPGVQVGQDQYCVETGKAPGHKCARKTINAQYNS